MNVSSGMLARQLERHRFRGGSVRRVLVAGGEAELPIDVSEMDSVEQVVWLPTDTREAGRATGVAGLDLHDLIAVPDFEDKGRFDAVLLPASPNRDLARRWLVLTESVLTDGGVLAVAGPNDEGIRSVISDAASLFGSVDTEDYARRHRVARFVAGRTPIEHPGWTTRPGIARGTWQYVEVDDDSGVLSLATLPGVFAGNRLDAGTALLLAHLKIPAGIRVLDVGCGTGAIGLMALRRGAGRVDMTDVDVFALASVHHSIAMNDLVGVETFASDVYEGLPSDRYDLIASNPPFHQGKQVDHDMAERLIRGAPAHLADDGRMLIVANAFLAYGKIMERHFHDVRTVAATRQYHVLEATSPR